MEGGRARGEGDRGRERCEMCVCEWVHVYVCMCVWREGRE